MSVPIRHAPSKWAWAPVERDLPTFPRAHRTVAVQEWQASRTPVEVSPDGREWWLVLTAHDGTSVELPADLIRDLAAVLDAAQPPRCDRCDLYATHTNPARCHEHGPTTHAWKG